MMNAMPCSYVGESAKYFKNSMIFRDFFCNFAVDFQIRTKSINIIRYEGNITEN